jgi:SPP1 gp7 family putative phage head morphogenesis protein
MKFRFTKAHTARSMHVTKATGENKALLDRLRGFLDAEEPTTIRFFYSLWGEQTNAITYAELRDALISGSITQERLEQWQRDYAKLVTEKLAPQWAQAMAAGAAKIVEKYDLFYDPMFEAAQNYITAHGAELATALAREQRDALQSLVSNAVTYEAGTPDELAQAIRPLVGLTAPQAAANLKLYESVKLSLKEANPNMRDATAEKRAREAALKYADKQHRYRAMTIARTELATAYNQGAYNGTRQAQAEGYLGIVKKVWLTADDERTCDICNGLDGEAVDMDSDFSYQKGKLGFGTALIPPAHPNCRCSIAYEEVSPPVFAPNRENRLTNDKENVIIDIGSDEMDFTGASGAIPRDDWTRMDDHAARYYESVRTRLGDVESIAKNTSFSVDEIETIRQHVFINQYQLETKKPKRFDPSYDMAVSWQRLVDGKDIHEMDIVMLNHELMEYRLMTVEGLPYDVAHEMTNEVYNYQKYTDALDRKAGLK